LALVNPCPRIDASDFCGSNQNRIEESCGVTLRWPQRHDRGIPVEWIHFVAIPVMWRRALIAASDDRALPPLHNISCFGLRYSRDGYSIPNFGGRKCLISFLDRGRWCSTISAAHFCKSAWSICSIVLTKVTASLHLLTESLTFDQLCGVHARESVPATVWSGRTPHNGDRHKTALLLSSTKDPISRST
jgi:hypothetical protein